MAHHCHAISINHAQSDALINGCLRAGHKLNDIGVVRLCLPFSDTPYRCVKLIAYRQRGVPSKAGVSNAEARGYVAGSKSATCRKR